MSLGTVKPVVGRTFKMRVGGVAFIEAPDLFLTNWPFRGYEVGDDHRAQMNWDKEGRYATSGDPDEYDLVEMLP